jgi:hypothetical protein
MSEARQNKSEPSEEFARALDRDEARRLETRLLTDSALAEAALRKTAAPGQPVHSSPLPPSTLSAEEGLQDGHRVKAERLESPAQPAPSEPAPTPTPSPAAYAPERAEEPVPAPPMRRAAVRDRRFLYLAALAVVLPVAVLLISRALQPAPLFPPQMALPQASMRPPRPRPNQPMPLVPPEKAGPSENLRRPTSATAAASAQPEGPAPQASPTASPSPATTAAVTPPKPPVTPTAPTSASSAPNPPGVEPFFKRAP